MSAPEDTAKLILEHVAHIARGCRSGRSHNPAVHEHAIADAVERLTAERDEARADSEAAYRDLWKAREKQEDAEAERDRLAAALRDLVSWADEPQAMTGSGSLTILELRIQRGRAALAGSADTAAEEA